MTKRKIVIFLAVCTILLACVLCACGVQEFSVVFDSNGGGTIHSIKIKKGHETIFPPTPSKQNFLFDGWYLEKSLSTPFDASTKISKDLTLYAKWKSAYKTTTKDDGTLSIVDYDGAEFKLNVPSQIDVVSVSEIAAGAFLNCTFLQEVVVPPCVATIGKSTFGFCTGLKSLVLPFVGNTVRIDDKAYFGYIFGADNVYGNSNCVPVSLKTVEITSCNKIGAQAFFACTDIEKVVLCQSVTDIQDSAFNGCSSLKEISLPSDLISVGKFAFFSCTALTKTGWDISSKIEKVGEYAYAYCVSLTSVEIPVSLTVVGENAFEQCSALQKLSFAISDGWFAMETDDDDVGVEIDFSPTDQIANAQKAVEYGGFCWKRR